MYGTLFKIKAADGRLITVEPLLFDRARVTISANEVSIVVDDAW